ncbi:hypothetical protein [Tenacibaculum halocynthiae]|uniref:hypothetical protein n=1 Tax=Tenacibaculum halocynthiae TaxID=1254437 RepID=UPI003D64A3A8
MRNKILIILLFTIFSCSNKEIKTELKTIYQESAKFEKDTLEIESFEILNISIVDYNYFQNVKINNLNYSIELDKMIITNCKETIRLLNKNISRRNQLIKLNPKDKEKYLKEIELDKLRLNENKTEIEKFETNIALTHQQIVLINAEIGQNKDIKFDLIEYVFNGKINNKKRIDTMSILNSNEYLPKFIKNKIFTKYNGK